MSEELPPDPFRAGVPDLAGWAGSCYSMFLALLSSGFSEDQALRLVAELTARMTSAHPAP